MVKTALPYENIGFLAASLPPKRPFKGPKLFEGPPWSSRPSFWIFSGSLATIIENSSSYPYLEACIETLLESSPYPPLSEWLVCPHGSQDAFKIPFKDILKVFEGLSKDLQRPSTWGRERERESERDQ